METNVTNVALFSEISTWDVVTGSDFTQPHTNLSMLPRGALNIHMCREVILPQCVPPHPGKYENSVILRDYNAIPNVLLWNHIEH